MQFFGETSNHPGESVPLQPRFGILWLLAFPQTKITFEREEISDHQWDSGKHNKAADGNWENCVRSQGDYFEGNWGVIVLCTIFLVSSSINISIFHITWLDTFWRDLIFFCKWPPFCHSDIQILPLLLELPTFTTMCLNVLLYYSFSAFSISVESIWWDWETTLCAGLN